MAPISSQLKLKYSHNIIDHLGLKLYQNKPTNVIAELVSNSWDAEAKNLWININSNVDAQQLITVADDGCGMSLEELKANYLVIGKIKNVDRKPTDNRAPMGRKGIGKLAPFGIAKKVTVVTVKNNLVNCFELDYSKMISLAENGDGIVSYYPKHLIEDKSVQEVEGSPNPVSSVQEIDGVELLNTEIINFLNKIKESESGTLIICSDLKLKKTIQPDALIKSLAKRFTVTLNREDFKVYINDNRLDEAVCLPTWALRIPESGVTEEEVIISEGVAKKIRHWVGFVESAQWPSEESGVGVYAHGKIAQDRPFFFYSKGNEIFTRYMYAVVEADWIDEDADDEISTDRTSINWSDEEKFGRFSEWGKAKVRDWVGAYKTFKTEREKSINEEQIKIVVDNQPIKLTKAEQTHVNSIISEITPHLDQDKDQKDKLILATIKAWTREPSRNLIQKLWKETTHFNPKDFSRIILQLEEQMVPESLSLAASFAQRVFALSLLYKHIHLSEETQLQHLIEQFPWILSNDYENYIADRTLATIIKEAEKAKIISTRDLFETEQIERTRPDFAFFKTGDEQEFLIVELKGPKITAAYAELSQLLSYVAYIKSRYPTAKVSGILISGTMDSSLESMKGSAISLMTWDQVLQTSRKDHVQLLAALLANADSDIQGETVRQICNLGGKEVEEFLSSMAKHNERLESVMRLLKMPAKIQETQNIES